MRTSQLLRLGIVLSILFAFFFLPTIVEREIVEGWFRWQHQKDPSLYYLTGFWWMLVCLGILTLLIIFVIKPTITYVKDGEYTVWDD